MHHDLVIESRGRKGHSRDSVRASNPGGITRKATWVPLISARLWAGILETPQMTPFQRNKGGWGPVERPSDQQEGTQIVNGLFGFHWCDHTGIKHHFSQDKATPRLTLRLWLHLSSPTPSLPTPFQLLQ